MTTVNETEQNYNEDCMCGIVVDSKFSYVLLSNTILIASGCSASIMMVALNDAQSS